MPSCPCRSSSVTPWSPSVHSPETGVSLLELCVDRGGLRKGVRVCSFIIEWGICAGAMGREPTVVEFRDWWNAKNRTVWHRLAEFRGIFDTDETPQVFVPALSTELADLGRSADSTNAAIAGMRARLTFIPHGIATQGPLAS